MDNHVSEDSFWQYMCVFFLSILMCSTAEVMELCTSWPPADRASFFISILEVAVTALAVCVVLRCFGYEWLFVLNMIAGLVIGMVTIDILYFFF